MPRTRILHCAALAVALAAAGAPRHVAASDDAIAPPPQPGIGAHDPRMRVDPNTAPWRAVGKLQATTGNLRTACTGTLIGPATVLTAAHCVFNPRTRTFFSAAALHFLIGFERGAFVGHATGLRLVISPGYDPAQPARTRGSDWALLVIDTPLGTADRVLAISERAPETGTAVAIGGYSADHPNWLTADATCRIVGRAADGDGRPLLRHNCTATHGASGAPVLVRDGAAWRIGGIEVAAERGVAGGTAALVDEARKRQ
jgi:protease YdgD